MTPEEETGPQPSPAPQPPSDQPPAAPTPTRPTPAVPKGPQKSIQQIQVDQSKVWNLWFTRREFLTLAGWGVVFVWLGGSALALLRFFIPRITYDPPSLFKIGKPEEYSAGTVDERWKKKHRIWIVRESPAEGGGMFVIFARCTHLGCTPNWLEGQNKFKCPCHGSGFRRAGINFEGPAPRPLERCHVALADDGQVLVDAGTRFRNPKDWKKPEAYLKVKV